MDLVNNITVVNALDIQTIDSDTTTAGDVIDTKGYESVTFLAQTGTVTDGDYAFNVQVGNLANGSDMADASAEELIGSEPNFADDTDDNAVARVGVITDKRYVRVQVVSTNTTSGALIGATAVLGHPHVAPTDAQNG